jgi:predicted permease
MARIPVEWNWRVFAFTAGATLAATLIAGLAPALSAVRPPTRRGAAPASRRLGRTLIVAQIALSMVLLSVAGMLTRSLWNLRHQDFGYHPDRLVVADLPWEFSPAMMARYAAVYQPLLDRMEALPDIRFSALCGFGPLSQAGQHTGPFAAPGGAAAGMRIVHVSARFFETAGIPITAGRGITDDDRAPSPRVAVLSETAARELFSRDNPVGRSISDTQAYDPLRAMEVAGVARDVRFAGPTEPHTAVVYVAMPQFPAPITSAMARAGGDPGRAAANLRAAIHSVDPDLAVSSVRGAAEIIDSQLGRERVLAFVASGFALLALALTAIGVYGLVSYAVEQRTREIGIRAALGARQGQIVGMIVGELAIAAGSSAALGVVGAVATGQAIRGVLFGTAEDSRAVAGAALLLVIVGAMAAWLPARRAARRDPVAALRQD